MKTKNVVLLVVLLLVIVFGGWFWESKLPVAASDLKTPAEDLHTYTNKDYGFQVSFSDSWKGYRVDKAGSDNGGEPCVISGVDYCPTSYFFQMPTTDKSFGDHSGWADVFSITTYPVNKWKELMKDSEFPRPIVITQNDKYVFAYSTWQDGPSDLFKLNSDLPNVINTFKLIK